MLNIETYNFKDKKALIRVDFNIPMNDKLEIVDDIRIKTTIPTINKVLNDGGSVILVSHLGRPKAHYDSRFSLSHLVTHLQKIFKREILFSNSCVGEEPKRLAKKLCSEDILLLENVRFHREELDGDKCFAKDLASIADVYINDAFGTSHRSHASLTVVPHYFTDKMIGYNMKKEVTSADKILTSPKSDFTAILGGAKILDKIEFIDGLIEKAKNIIVGGGIANTFYASKGCNVGNSLVEKKGFDLAIRFMKKAIKFDTKFFLPSDSYIVDRFHNEANKSISASNDIPKHWISIDIGPQSQHMFREIILKTKNILWNGPMGVYEMTNFREGTKSIAESVVTATHLGAFSLVGGGDSAAAIHMLGYENKISYLSTGGGALLSYISKGYLPAIKALGK